MNQREMAELADYLEARLREIGETEIADPRLYTYEFEETGEQHLVDPRKRIVLMLDALERSAVLLDRSTFDSARARLQDNVKGMEDVDIVVRRVDRPERERASYRLDEERQTEPLFAELRQFRARVMEDPGE